MGRRKTERRTRGRRKSSFGALRREEETREGGGKSRRTVRKGVRDERGPSGRHRESVRKMTLLVELRKI